MDKPAVLLVDTEDRFLGELSAWIAKRGLRAKTVASGRDALGMLEAGSLIRVVVVDSGIPDIDGHDLLNIIGKRFPDVRVILLSAHATVEDAIRAIRDGAFDYMLKPADIRTLYEKIRDAWRLHPSSVPLGA